MGAIGSLWTFSSTAFNRLQRDIKVLCEAFETINYHVFNQLRRVTAFDPVFRSRTCRNGENRFAKYWRLVCLVESSPYPKIDGFITTEMVRSGQQPAARSSFFG